ncbi:c-type cytochrome biogenesis protein CcmI [Pseudomonas sp. N040]|uniref:c-type cytochrome biogenesis protein CcmI n=1 Tax=Pseudomonas sp. N040 TaxID=2785325 RepID=UPI0018A2A1C3|nr:c-type cytochrome biogenesis protein CcmI [Pseudomonas sp. N040]MBF7730836.1 c-type cytochrome biogenesis protein CcmI [Pseudomonas sp. N040]MBW7014479.1 c-type cytochrome biogenesis protein CcmI [Pseudomonas sp. N040]
MLDLWLSAGLLLLVALGFLLVPLLRGYRQHAVEDRTALNVALYQERLAELAAQQAAGTLSGEQLETGKAEAARELLADTEGKAAVTTASLGRRVPLLVALVLPLLGFGLYLHWGGSEQVALTREYANAPRTLEEMTARLEETVKLQPDAAEAWYFLGRAYMGQERFADAARAFQRAAELANRPAEVLGMLAQARFFAGGRQWSPDIQRLTDEALQADPQETTSLGLLGIAAFEAGRYAEAIGFWQRLVAVLPPEDTARAQIETGIQRAREQLLAAGGTLPEPAAASSAALLTVSVDLAPALRDQVQPGDSLFVFAKAVSGPPMPLAVKRLTVADLPVQVSLSDADAMMPQLKISMFPQVQLMARISRAGNATAGEWVGRNQPVASSTSAVQQITIDSPDQP